MNNIPDIPDNLTTEEKLVWAMRFAGNREKFLAIVSRILGERDPNAPPPNNYVPPGPYIALALR
jgi:hypothetical protein